ncbi:MAG: hypothetical protein IPO95_15010 [Rhodanobacteraceae bacterium]|nr:hypothetical protein [Rhodanobacteraceae bacterium]MBL0041498.1 hypothetical protein [Xanthomonadales bacterium]MBP6078160.1 hypothetical protein [Xanthomonadales bacterium]MBP7622889.1 hypothetical protein [Xanthomonadales bacterium]
MPCPRTPTFHTLALMLAVLASAASADTRTWPGSTPCNASLQTCVNAASQGDRIEIATDTPIAETVITSNRNISVVAATGFHPRFAAGHNLGISSSLSNGGPAFMQVEVAGLAFDGGCLGYTSDVPGIVEFHDLDITMPANGCGTGIAITLNASPGNALNTALYIERARVSTSLSAIAGINIQSARDTFATLTDNLVDSQPGTPSTGPIAFRRGISISHTVGQGTYYLWRNRVTDHRDPSIAAARLRTGLFAAVDGTGVMHLRIADSAFRTGTTSGDYGVQINAFGGSVFAEAYHNTVITDGGGGIAMLRQSANPLPMSLDTYNNLLATSSSRVAILADPPEGIAVFNDYNLLSGSSGDTGIGPHSQIGAAGFASPTDWHLAPNSAARDTGNLGVRHPGLPDLDGDGLRRVRGPSVDIGAFEYGDASFSHANPQTQTLSTVQRASLNEHPEALLHITRSDGGGGLLFFPNARPMSQSYDELAQRWNLRSDDGLSLGLGTVYALFQPERNGNAGTHVAAASTMLGGTSLLPEPWASLSGNSLFFVSATRGASLSNVANPHPFAAIYTGDAWRIANSDGSIVPTGSAYVVYAQERSRNAYVHSVRFDNTPSPTVSYLDHPDLNGHRCAPPHVAINGNGQMPTPQVTVRYDGELERWYLLDETPGTQFEFGNRYNILVDPRLGQDGCTGTLFNDGFE